MAVSYGYEGLLGDFLECFRATNVASIGIDQEQRFDLGNTGYNSTDGNKLSEVSPLDISNSHSDVRSQRLKVKVASLKVRSLKMGNSHFRHALSSEQVVWETLLSAFYPVIPFASLVENNVNDFIVFTNVLRREWHDSVNNLAE